MSERRVLYRHAVRAALTPVVSQLGIDIGALLGGVIVVEQVFGLQGLGQQTVTAITQGDGQLVIGFVIIAALFVVVANLIVDMSYALLDPRVRSQLTRPDRWPRGGRRRCTRSPRVACPRMSEYLACPLGRIVCFPRIMH